MEPFTVTRRSFLGATLAALPAFSSVSSLLRLSLKECEFGIGAHAFPMVYITTFSDGALSATWQGVACEVLKDRHWWLIRSKVGETLCEVRARRGDATSLDIDWFKFAAPDSLVFDDFSPFDDSKFVQAVDADWEWPLTPSQIRGAVRLTA